MASFWVITWHLIANGFTTLWGYRKQPHNQIVSQPPSSRFSRASSDWSQFWYPPTGDDGGFRWWCPLFCSGGSALTSVNKTESNESVMWKIIIYEASFVPLRMMGRSLANGFQWGWMGDRNRCRGCKWKIENLTARTSLCYRCWLPRLVSLARAHQPTNANGMMFESTTKCSFSSWCTAGGYNRGVLPILNFV